MFKKYAWAIFYTAMLICFTVYISLDTFVIKRVYSAVPSDESDAGQQQYSSAVTDDTVPQTTPALPNETENSYSDKNIEITLTEYREYDTSIYVADINISSSEYLKTAFAEDSYGRNVTEKTSEIAQSQDAILAINGDFYGSQQSGYVIRNGVLYRDTPKSDQQDLVIYSDGSFDIILEQQTTAEQLMLDGAVQVLSFGPALVEDGRVTVSQNDEVGKAMASNPRTAIGIIEQGHYIFVVSDGRTSQSEGLSLSQLAEFMQGLGVKTAYNLDGGGSSTMNFNGEVVNNPTTNGRSIKERSVSDIVYIGY